MADEKALPPNVRGQGLLKERCRLLLGMLAGSGGVLVRLRAVLVRGGGVLVGFFVVALIVLVGRLMVMVLGGGVVRGRVQVVFGGGMLGGCHDGNSSLNPSRSGPLVILDVAVQVYQQSSSSQTGLH